MSIIKEEKEEKNFAQVTKDKIISDNTSLFNKLKDSIAMGFTDVWNNPGAIPQEIMDQFGTDATSLFNVSYQAQLLLKAINSDYEVLTPPEQYKIDFNGDGTVKLTDTTPPPAEETTPASPTE